MHNRDRDRVEARQAGNYLVIKWQGESPQDAAESGEWVKGTPVEVEQ